MQIYTSPEFFGDYHVNFPITGSHLTNGMRTRMSALHYALKIPVIGDIKSATGPLVVEPFAFKPRPAEREALKSGSITWDECVQTYVDEVCGYDKGYKILLCSEMEVLRWSGAMRERLMSEFRDVWTTCKYQQALLETAGYTSDILPEPINAYLFYPVPKTPKQIVAIGAANHPKNTEMLIDFYTALEGQGYHRVYIGGPLVWGDVRDQMMDKSFQYNMDCYYALKAVCDTFYEAIPGTRVARILSESEFYVNFAYHEVGCRTVLEALMSGCGILWGQHPLGSELPVLCSAATVDEAVAAVGEHTGRVNAEQMRAYAEAHYSFASVNAQYRKLIYEH